jgi:cysteinyl-tRNA synthetase
MKLYNTLGRRLEEFHPRDEGRVAMYVCGPTVQSAPHLGHGRAAVVFDVMRRYFEWVGYEVEFVVNVTDVEDKIIAAAQERGIEPEQVAAEAAEQFFAGYAALGVRAGTVTPYATAHIPEMIVLIEELIATGHAYAAEGDVYFAVRSYSDYGKLSGHDPDELVAGSRVEPGEHKRDPLDFALWKAAKPGEPSWESPWGEGRPGWHIECSAMAAKYLGASFDIHGGGLDLVFPHHENEIAQAEAPQGVPFARYWVHNGLVNLTGEKMAKSTGQLIGLLDAVDRYPPTAIRLWYLRKHYRSPLEFSEEALEDAANTLDRLWSFRRRARDVFGEADDDALSRFRSAMADDLNTAEALAVLFETVAEGNRRFDAGEDAVSLVATYDEMVAVLGLEEPAIQLGDLADELAGLAGRAGLEAEGDAGDIVEALIAKREQARRDQDFETSDAVRDGLAALGVVLEDTADGTRWHRR